MSRQRFLPAVATLACSFSCAYGQELVSDPLVFPDSAFVVLMDEAGVGALAGPEGATIETSRDPSSQTGLAVLSGVPEGAPSNGRPGIYLTIPAEIEISGHALPTNMQNQQTRVLT